MSRRLLEISSIDDPLRPKLETFFNSSGIYFTAEGTQGEAGGRVLLGTWNWEGSQESKLEGGEQGHSGERRRNDR